MEALLMLIILGSLSLAAYLLINYPFDPPKDGKQRDDDRQKKPKRRRITRIEDIDGRIYFRGAPPEEWKALEEEYQRQQREKYYR